MVELLKLAEVARRLGISEPTARRYVKSGKLPSIYVGGSYRVRDTDIEEFLRQAQVRPGENLPKAGAPSSTEPSLNDVLEEEWRAQHLGVWKSYLLRRVEWCEKVVQKRADDDWNNPFLSLDTAIQWAIYVGIESAQLRDAVRTEVRSYTDEVRSYTDADSDIVGELHALLDRFVAVEDTTDVRVRAMMDEAGLTDEDKEQRLRLIHGSAA